MFGKNKIQKTIDHAVGAYTDFIQNALEDGGSPDDALQALESAVKYYGKRGMPQTNTLIMLIIGCFHKNRKIANKAEFEKIAIKKGILSKEFEITCNGDELYGFLIDVICK